MKAEQILGCAWFALKFDARRVVFSGDLLTERRAAGRRVSSDRLMLPLPAVARAV